MLMDLIKKIDKPKYIEFFSTDWALSLNDIKNYQNDGYKIIYEYIDDIFHVLLI